VIPDWKRKDECYATQGWLKKFVFERKKERLKREWEERRPRSYRELGLEFKSPYAVIKNREITGYLIVLRSGYRNFQEYHKRFRYNTYLKYICGLRKSKKYLLFCMQANRKLDRLIRYIKKRKVGPSKFAYLYIRGLKTLAK
jgi:hypothetical protein